MKLLVNTFTIRDSSRGVNRYFQNIMKYLEWPGEIIMPPTFDSIRKNRVHENLMRGAKDTVLWSPVHRGPRFAMNHVVTVHDCLNLEYVHTSGWKHAALKLTTQALLNSSASVVSISHATKDAILRNYRVSTDRITVIQSSCEVDYLARPIQPPVRDNYLLLVTNTFRHRNNEFVCRALARANLQREIERVVVVGDLPPIARQSLEGAGIAVDFLRGLSDQELAMLYARTRLYLSGSMSEGHNLAIAEALHCGAPVLCSDIPVHHEFYGDMVDYFDPRSEDSFVEALRRNLHSAHPVLEYHPERSLKLVSQDYNRHFRSML